MESMLLSAITTQVNLQAIHLVSPACKCKECLKINFSKELFNNKVKDEYIASLKTETPLPPPSISIEIIYYEINDNSTMSFKCTYEFDNKYDKEYKDFIRSNANINDIPVKYYTERVQQNKKAKSVFIDSTEMCINCEMGYFASRNKEGFEKQIIELLKIILGREVSVSLSLKNNYKKNPACYLDKVPLDHIGKGLLNIISLCISFKKPTSQSANIILIEEPENHLSHSMLNSTMHHIHSFLENKQIIISTHSSFFANKLGIGNVIFLHDAKAMSFNELSNDTKDFFLTLAGYDTLRLILCKYAILVEGDSDELIVQKAYMDQNNKLPIQDGIDVISVGTSFLRFLEIAEKIDKTVYVVTDNDGNVDAIKKKYKDYLKNNSKKNIKICFDHTEDSGKNSAFNYNTLEPKILNENGRDVLNKIFETKYKTDEEINVYMKNNKTHCALKIFNTKEKIKFPKYILDAIEIKTAR